MLYSEMVPLRRNPKLRHTRCGHRESLSRPPAQLRDRCRRARWPASWATSEQECKDGRWRAFLQFKNQGQCVAFVVAG